MTRSKLFLFMFIWLSTRTWACQGSASEKAQEQDASILFEAEPVGFELGMGILQQPNARRDNPSVPLAKVTFKVTKPIRGERRSHWVALMRGTPLPKSLNEFKLRFSSHLKVGLREVSDDLDQSKLPGHFRKIPFVVNAACSTHGEDWLLKAIPTR